jgi:hypothetical protein
MKALCWLLMLGASAITASAAPKSVNLVGIVRYDKELAILEITWTNRHSNTSEQTILANGQSGWGIEIKSIDITNGSVDATIDGDPRTLRFDVHSSKPIAAGPTIRLRDVKLQPLMVLYGEAKGRTVLAYPRLGDARFSLDSNANYQTAAETFEKLFADQNIATIPDGDKFVMLVPNAYTNQVSPHSDKIAAAGPIISEMSINFQNVPLAKVLEVYGEYVGHPVNNLQSSPNALIHFVQQNPLSKGQICYGLETIFAWNGVRVVTNNDSSSSWERISQ